MPTIYSGDANPTNALSMRAVATIELAGAEISAYDPVSKKLFVTSNVGLQVIDLSTPSAPVLLTTVLFTDLGFNSNDVTSVAVRDGVVAVALVDEVKTNLGNVVLLDAEGSLLGSVRVGALPDMLTFTPDGSKILVANEGEPLTDENGLADPVGRISIIDISAGPAAATVVHAGFSAFDEQQEELAAQGIRFDAGKTVSQAIEPEYIAISPDGTRAIITLQENNAFAILDLTTNVITEIRPLGTKDFSNPFNAIDASDRDGGINIAPWPVKGLYMPDAIASFTANGQTYYVTANEGDAYDPFGQLGRGDAVRLKDLDLDPTAFPDAAELQADENLGRLNVSSMMGDTDGDGDYDEIYTFGGRSFSIWDASGNQVFDSGNIIERATALLTPDLFNANDGVASAFDGRSDDKGAEPEGLTVGEVDGKTYVFLGLERSGGGVMAFDVTDPANVQFAQYALNPGDISPEGLTFINGDVSPSGKDLIAVTNEVSSTLTIYEVEPAVTEPFKLQLLHFSDAEAGLLAGDTAPILGALIDRFDDEYANTLVLSGGDNFIPGPFLAAGTDPSLNAISSIGATAWGRPDVAILNQMGVEVSAIGNHEWDLGSAVYADATRPAGAWVGAQYAMVSANLDFSADSAIAPRTTAAGQEASSIKGLIAPWVTVTEGGEKIGILGATTQILERISSPTGTEVNGFPKAGEAGDGAVEVDDMVLLASQLQPIIDQMIASGIDKIVLTTHLQNIENEKLLATLLKGVDIILAAGSNTRLGDANDIAAEFPGHAADFADGYPLLAVGVDGNPTLIVNTDGEYTYLGRLVVEFDEEGVIDISALDDTINGAYASTQEVLAQVYGEDIAEAFAPGSIGANVTEITEAVDAVISEKDGNVFGYSDVYLEGERSAVRGQETNFGNLAADAQLAALVDALGDEAETTFVASMKNGGGIRAQIGTILDTPDGPVKAPTQGNPDAGKEPGAISQLDIENSLRFNNGLMAVDVSSADLLAILEYGVGGTPPTNQGRFPQIGGVSFSWDPTKPAGQRVSDVALIDENGVVVAEIADNGQLLAGAPAVITVVTLNFMANGGDGYPFKTLGENFRFLLDDGTLSAPVDPSLNFTDAAVVPANMLKEQQNLQDYLAEHHATPETAFQAADTAETGDTRIQNLTVREDTVLVGEPPAEVPGELIEGTHRGDFLDGTDGDDTILAHGGRDTAHGGDGDDLIDGGSHDDRLFGGAGDDLLFGASGNDRVYGEEGDDIIDGGSGNDRLYGGDGDDAIDGGEGRDALYGEDGHDTLAGGSGDDTIYAGLGDDTVEGGSGSDRLYGEDGEDQIFGDSGNDLIEAGDGDDFVDAGHGNDRVYGGDGSDVLEGGSGHDKLYGGAGDDLIFGGEGHDNIYGGRGDDVLVGDAGRDVFYFENHFGNDVIEDFEVGTDRINMQSVSNLRSFANLAITQDGQDVVITVGGNTITLLDVSASDLDRHDVIV